MRAGSAARKLSTRMGRNDFVRGDVLAALAITLLGKQSADGP